jgi:tRNA threonylcarbamoyl adenosine modification protein (Sua5/YciO/YrdC/YwlC family)
MTAPILPIQQPSSIDRAVEALRAGEIIVIPTDTVYGLAVAPKAQGTLRKRLYRDRNRETWPALPVLLDVDEPIQRLSRSNRSAERLAQYFWPGALTLLLAAAAETPLPSEITQVALRVPNFPPLWPLLRAMGGFLIVGRAARSGYPSAITAQEAADQLGDEVALILDGGAATFGLMSTIVSCIESPPRIVQRGAIPEDKVCSVVELA